MLCWGRDTLCHASSPCLEESHLSPSCTSAMSKATAHCSNWLLVPTAKNTPTTTTLCKGSCLRIDFCLVVCSDWLTGGEHSHASSSERRAHRGPAEDCGNWSRCGWEERSKYVERPAKLERLCNYLVFGLTFFFLLEKLKAKLVLSDNTDESISLKSIFTFLLKIKKSKSLVFWVFYSFFLADSNKHNLVRL